MSSNFQNPSADRGASHVANCGAEETLHLIANLPAPEGLEDRIHKVLHSAPHRGSVLAWPAYSWLSGEWMRTAAAAAIAFVVAGGGWSIYSRVQPGQPAKIAIMPAQAAPAGFSSAGAIRTPQTLNGPVIAPAAKPHSVQKAAKKTRVSHPQTAARKAAAPSITSASH